eukprot:CCRYP_001611-RB/>CCRYP_001611-RB protein AED:0.13 eAED:0.13 QI:278/1/1/1/0.75/0.55/9/2146/915
MWPKPPIKETIMETSSQCLRSSPTGTCTLLPTLSLPAPLSPLFSSDCTLLTPLFLLGIFLLLISLCASHYLSRSPITELGQLGPRGRRNYSWNESTHGAGGRFVDWWLFGGCVWIRSSLFLWDRMCHFLGLSHGGADEDGEESCGGENLFACFGVVHNHDYKNKDGKAAENADTTRNEQTHQGKHGIGIIGYDSSLGAHGPVVLAPIRASVFILAWCSIGAFFVRAHAELTHFLIHYNAETFNFLPTSLRENLITMAFYVLQGIEYIFGRYPYFLQDEVLPSDSSMIGMITCAIIYATALITTLELALYVVGKLFSMIGIYVPKGVSHPGGPRPHKIVRVPKWTEGKKHFLPEELLMGQNNIKWRCAVAHDAHRDTLAKFNKAAGKVEVSDTTKEILLTGEPFGRQLWTMLEPQPCDQNVESEDDLNMTLRKALIPSKSNSEGTQQQPEAKEDMPNLFKQISDLFNPNVNPQSKSKPSKQSELVQLLASGGRRPWAFDPSKNPNSCDQIFRAQMISSYLEENEGKLPDDIAHIQRDESKKQIPAKTVKEAAKRGVAFYSMLQSPDGHWAGDYGGPHFLMPGLIVAWYVMGRPALMISPPQQALMLHYLKVHQQEDGGWGTHIESPSTMFGTVICYLAVRLLGAKRDEKWVTHARDFILKEGGAVMTSSWAKFWLCLIGCMDWKGHNSVPPEMWLLPNWFPFHPGRLWCHCRMVYLPMGYIYGSRFTYSDAENDPLIKELRQELYAEPYESIDWDRTRHLVAPMDNYSPIPTFMKFAQNCLSFYENYRVFRPFRDAVRGAGLKFCLEYMRAEDLQTNYIDIGPVNKALNMVAAFHAANNDINDPAVQSHMTRVPDYLWLAEDGMKMQGYNGSQCWDTSFAIQAVFECGLLDHFPLLSTKVWAYLERTQILSTETSQ